MDSGDRYSSGKQRDKLEEFSATALSYYDWKPSCLSLGDI